METLSITKMADEKCAQDIAYIKEILGENVLASIRTEFHRALQNPTLVSKHTDSIYKVQWRQMLDRNEVRKGAEGTFFMRNYFNPSVHLMPLLNPPKDIELIECKTVNLSNATVLLLSMQDMCCSLTGRGTMLLCCFTPLLCVNSINSNNISVTITVYFKHTDATKED